MQVDQSERFIVHLKGFCNYVSKAENVWFHGTVVYYIHVL